MPTLLEQWITEAYSDSKSKKESKRFWEEEYFPKEEEIYKELLQNPDEVVTGTVEELAKKYDLSVLMMTGFLHGINDSLTEPNPMETLTAGTVVNLGFDKELLYKNMVKAKAHWLYELPEWKAIFSSEKLKELFAQAKGEDTIVKPKKIGRNDPCPCGSGKKYKYCCGRTA